LLQQQLKILGDRAVAYLNVDIAVEGMQALGASGVPLLYDMLYNATKKVSIYSCMISLNRKMSCHLSMSK